MLSGNPYLVVTKARILQLINRTPGLLIGIEYSHYQWHMPHRHVHPPDPLHNKACSCSSIHGSRIKAINLYMDSVRPFFPCSTRIGDMKSDMRPLPTCYNNGRGTTARYTR